MLGQLWTLPAMLDLLLLLLAVGFAGYAWKHRAALGFARAAAAAGPRATPAPAVPVQPTSSSLLGQLQGSEQGWLRTGTAEELLQAVSAQLPLDHMMRQSRLSKAVWERDLLAAIERYAEFVQLMPASESHHHAHAGGLLAHTLEVLLAAMTWRNGCLLPQGATAEDLDAQRDHWTYAVFFGALLHDIGKPLTDLRLSWKVRGKAEALRWSPIAGSLVDCQAEQYRVEFAPTSERDYSAHAKASTQLLQRIAPPSALKFLALQPSALDALMRYLAGEDKDGDIARLVRRADQASTRRALATGSRARFNTALRQPLIEVLMGAMREMLQRGGELPLNRDGAVGWVYEDSVYFVAKRVADLVREHVRQHHPDEAIPGEERNDRLFDTWQEYGYCMANPATQQSVWHVLVHGEDAGGYCHSLSMLRFPLAKIWDSPERYPTAMAGRIEVVARRASSKAGAVGEAGSASEQRRADAAGDSGAGAESGPAGAQKASGAAAAGQAKAKAEKSVRAPTFGAGKRAAAAPSELASMQSKAAPALAVANPPITESLMEGPFGEFDEPLDADSFLPDEEDAGREAKRQAAARSVPAATTISPRPVVMPPAAPPLPLAEGAKAPTAGAMAFMSWLQAGLAAGEIRYNAAGAPVHFVEQGMALVSPLIFRQFAMAQGAASEAAPERLGLDVQREVLRAGWHVPAPDGLNIHCFTVQKRGKSRSGKLAAVVLAQPARWVMPVPPSNPALQVVDD